jgi:hypothetical protein
MSIYVIDLPFPAPTVEGTLTEVTLAAETYRAENGTEDGFALWEREDGELVPVFGRTSGGYEASNRIYI